MVRAFFALLAAASAAIAQPAYDILIEGGHAIERPLHAAGRAARSRGIPRPRQAAATEATCKAADRAPGATLERSKA
jgi:hypothetical protein